MENATLAERSLRLSLGCFGGLAASILDIDDLLLYIEEASSSCDSSDELDNDGTSGWLDSSDSDSDFDSCMTVKGRNCNDGRCWCRVLKGDTTESRTIVRLVTEGGEMS